MNVGNCCSFTRPLFGLMKRYRCVFANSQGVASVPRESAVGRRVVAFRFPCARACTATCRSLKCWGHKAGGTLNSVFGRVARRVTRAQATKHCTPSYRTARKTTGRVLARFSLSPFPRFAFPLFGSKLFLTYSRLSGNVFDQHFDRLNAIPANVTQAFAQTGDQIPCDFFR
jgi:hypothetical protein